MQQAESSTIRAIKGFEPNVLWGKYTNIFNEINEMDTASNEKVTVSHLMLLHYLFIFSCYFFIIFKQHVSLSLIFFFQSSHRFLHLAVPKIEGRSHVCHFKETQKKNDLTVNSCPLTPEHILNPSG